MVTEDPVDLNLTISSSSRKIPALLTPHSHVRQRVMEKLCEFGCVRLMMMMNTTQGLPINNANQDDKEIIFKVTGVMIKNLGIYTSI